MARRGVGSESEVESVRFLGRRVTKVGPEVKHGLPKAWGPLNRGGEKRTWAPEVSGWRRKVNPLPASVKRTWIVPV